MVTLFCSEIRSLLVGRWNSLLFTSESAAVKQIITSCETSFLLQSFHRKLQKILRYHMWYKFFLAIGKLGTSRVGLV